MIAQCFHYALARPIITRLVSEAFYNPNTIDELTEHITRFSLAGIASMRSGASDKTKSYPHAAHGKGENP